MMPDETRVHRIRLAGPWDVITAAESKRIKMPSGWRNILGTYCGSAIFKRSFNSPVGLKNQRLFIVIPFTHGCGSVRLNSQFIGEFDETGSGTPGDSTIEKKYEITHHIGSYNQLEIELTCQPDLYPECGLDSAVLLEIVEDQRC